MTNIEANLRAICRHESKPNPRPIPSTTLTRGFEAVAFPKIVREIRDEDLEVKRRALIAARELLGSSTSYVQCIAAGITPAVIALLKDPCAVVRERAAGTTEYIASKEIGARDIVQHGGVPLLMALLEDEAMEVRDAAYAALIEAARFNAVRSALVETEHSLPRLMLLAVKEQNERSLQGLILLNACVQVRHNDEASRQLLDKSSAVPSLAQLISAGNAEPVQEQAAQLLGVVTSNFPEAKKEAVRIDCVPKLVNLLSQGTNVLLASAAATALMIITQVVEGKYAVIKCPGGLEALAGVQWLDPGLSEKLCLNLTQCITNLAEAPESRPILKGCGALERLLAIHNNPQNSEVVRQGAAEAIRQCRFNHLPHELLPGREGT